MAPETFTSGSAPASDAEAIISAVEELSASEVLEVSRGGLNASLLVVPKGKTIHPAKQFLDPYRTAPERRQGTAVLTQLESFIAHVNRFKDSDSAVFASTEQPSCAELVAVLDYHRVTAEGAPRFGQHRAIYKFPISEEWKAWTTKTGPMTIEQFGEFLEDRVVDVVDPVLVPEESSTLKLAKELGLGLASPQRLLNLSQGLSIHVKGAVTNAVKLSTGESQVNFVEEHEGRDKAGAPLTVPGGFLIGIPALRGGAPYIMLVRLRYRVEGAKILFWLALHRTEKVWEKAVDEACERAQAGTDLPVFYGRPEAP